MIRRPLRSTRSVTLLPYSTLFRTLHISYTDAQLLRYLPITQFFNTMSQIYLFRPGRKAVDSQTVTLPHLVQLRRCVWPGHFLAGCADHGVQRPGLGPAPHTRSEEHTSELQSTNAHLVCRLLLEKKKKNKISNHITYINTNKQKTSQQTD